MPHNSTQNLYFIDEFLLFQNDSHRLQMNRKLYFLVCAVRPKELQMADCEKNGKNAPWRSRTARAHPKMEVILRHMRARENV